MKKTYQKPTVTKIALNYQQAVLGTCTTGVTARANARQPSYCQKSPTCRQARQSKGADSGGSS